MIEGFFTRLIEGFNFGIKDLLVLIIITVFLIGGYKIYNMTENTNKKINAMEERYFHDVEENAFQVLASLQNNHILEPEDIKKFLSQKPAGRSDLKKGLQDEKIFLKLFSVYGTLAKNSKTALLY